MSYKFVGNITEILPMEWKGKNQTPIQQIVVHSKNKDGSMSKTGIIATFFSTRADQISVGMYKVGEEVEITYGLSATQYNGRRYQNIDGYGITRTNIPTSDKSWTGLADEIF